MSYTSTSDVGDEFLRAWTPESFIAAMTFWERCAQYIWSGHAVDALQLRQENADGPSATSGCGTFPSTFTVETTASGRAGFAVTTYKIPKADLFGKRATAHVLLEVLDDTGRHGYYSLGNPLVIVR